MYHCTLRAHSRFAVPLLQYSPTFAAGLGCAGYSLARGRGKFVGRSRCTTNIPPFSSSAITTDLASHGNLALDGESIYINIRAQRGAVQVCRGVICAAAAGGDREGACATTPRREEGFLGVP